MTNDTKSRLKQGVVNGITLAIQNPRIFFTRGFDEVVVDQSEDTKTEQ